MIDVAAIAGEGVAGGPAVLMILAITMQFGGLSGAEVAASDEDAARHVDRLLLAAMGYRGPAVVLDVVGVCGVVADPF